MVNRWHSLSKRKSYSIRASSLDCDASCSIAEILSLARRTASLSVSRLANCRSVGISPLIPGKSLRLSGEAGSNAFPGGRCQVIKAQPGCHKCRWRGIVCRLHIPLKAIESFMRVYSLSSYFFSIPENLRKSCQCVAESVKHPRSQYLLIGKCEQTLAQCQQMGSKIPAVHRRNIVGEQWFQSLRVVPVVEVAPVPFQSFHRVECIGRTFDELSSRNVAKVVSG